jgi:type IV pilus assembly protein PilV
MNTTPPTKIRRSTRRGDEGFTILEVLIAVLVLAIGFIGILGMQSVAIQTSRASSDIRVATEIAETTMERMQRDAQMWGQTGSPGDWGPGAWLNSALTEAGTGNFAWPPRPAGTSGREPAFNGLGLAQQDTTPSPDFTNRNNRFCVDYQTDWLRGATFARITVRVRWPRNGDGEAAVLNNCGNLEGLTAAILLRDFYQVRVTGIVRMDV